MKISLVHVGSVLNETGQHGCNISETLLFQGTAHSCRQEDIVHGDSGTITIGGGRAKFLMQEEVARERSDCKLSWGTEKRVKHKTKRTTKTV